ncbi:sensor histidine kinase [Ramlibacter humi]|uniref:histidine kinase n=1 Tax=Ramlibacter humi TaxID=2530451 RepID=A0A4Z0BI99_9BURK|nr:sensor histidine kinase [Ramlibacter humi]TFY98173.1 sensor histidine kinase [Ramlibacter humi]
MRWGLRSQLLALLLPGVAVALALDSWTDHHARVAAIEDALDEVLMQPLAVLDRAVEPDPAGGLRLGLTEGSRQLLDAMAAEPRHFHVEVWVEGSEPKTLFGAEALPAPPPGEAIGLTASPAVGESAVVYDATFRGQPVRVASLQHQRAGGDGRAWIVRVQAAESTGRRTQARNDSMWRELRQDARTLLLAAALVLLGVGWSLRPLHRLRDQMARRRPGDLAPLPVEGVPHEVTPLVDAVNLAVAQHREVLQEQERFLADAAHQLRTPIAVMMAQMEYARRAHDAAAEHEVLAALGAPLQRSRRIADQLLSISHAISAPLGEAPRVDLHEAAAETVLEALPAARQRGVDLGLSDPPQQPVFVRAEAAELHEILSNLVHNALRHTPAGGRVTVQVQAEGGTASAEVIDTGCGLDPARREAVFERFHSRSRTEGNSGAGLGLAIARAYARRRGGDVSLHDAPGGEQGLAARLTMPHSAD